MKLRTNIYLEAEQAAALDDAAHARGISRAELVRQLIDAGIRGTARTDLEADLAAIDRSFGVLGADTQLGTVSRGPDARAAHLRRVASRRVSPA